MEYTQWVILFIFINHKTLVLILVVMEYTQWGVFSDEEHIGDQSLNPCCNGIYSMSYIRVSLSVDKPVLILVVMEYTQWVYSC